MFETYLIKIYNTIGILNYTYNCNYVVTKHQILFIFQVVDISMYGEIFTK